MVSTFAHVPCHGRSRSTTAVFSNIPKTYDSSDDDAGIWTASFGGNCASNLFHRSRAATLAPSSPFHVPPKPDTPKSTATTSKSITGFHMRRRYQDQTRGDLGGRRCSANAEILESLGLPSMVSFQDMKTLQDGVREEDIRGYRKGHRRQHGRRVSECLSTYNDCVRGVTASVVRLARKVAPQGMLQKKQQDVEPESPTASVSTAAAAAVDEKKEEAGEVDERPVRTPTYVGSGDVPFRFPSEWTDEKTL